VLDRTEAAENVTHSVVAVGDCPENDAITEYCERTETPYVVGPEMDLVARHRAVAEQTDCDLLVRVTGDCPFVPPNEIDRLVDAHTQNSARYTTNHTPSMPIGVAIDVIEPHLLTELADIDATHPVKRPRSEPERWGTEWSDHEFWRPFADLHMAVDTPRDYWSLTDAVEAVGDEPRSIAEWLAG
jgi:spore coat polysaccharide biosynthesis protein SpsF